MDDMKEEQTQEGEEEIVLAEEEQEQEQEPVVERDEEAEAEARKYGWRPKEEFDRDPAGWVDAARFLELPSTGLKMARDTRKQLERDLKERDERLARIEATTKSAIEEVRRQERETAKKELDRIAAERRAAAEVGDMDRYDALERQGKEIAKTIKDPAPEHPSVPSRPPEVEQYIAESKWTKDPAAFSFASRMIEAHPEVMALPPLRQVKWAEQRVKEHFPEYFDAEKETEKKRGPSKVDPGGLGGLERRGKGASDLPQEAQAIGKEFVSQGLFKSLDDYAKAYFTQGA